MKKAEEYLKEWSFFVQIPTRELEAIINEAQKDAIKASLKMASEEVCLNYGDCIVVDTNSILDCEKKLLKQIK
jgi:hypothetical protein